MKSGAFGRSMAALGLAVLLGGMAPAEAPVADAAMRGDTEAVRSLLRGGADVNLSQGDGMTALHWAARRGDGELAEILIYAGASLDAGTRIGRYTPLHVATREGKAGVVEILLEAGADPQLATTNSGATPLHLAARSGDAEIVSKLLKHGAQVDVREAAWGQTPLIFAAAANRVEVIELLLDAGADPNATSTALDVVEMSAADNAAEQRLQQALQSFKEREGGGPAWQPTPSQVQAAVDIAREVQTRWPDLPSEDDAEDDASEEEGGSEAGEEAEEGEEVEGEPDEEEAVEDPAEEEEATEGEEAGEEGEAEEEEEEERPLSYAQQVGTWGGLTALHHAVRQGHVEAVLALLDGGAEIDSRTGDGTTPLLLATLNGQWDLASILIEKGGDPNATSNAGATPLYTVVERQWQPRASYAHPTEHLQQEIGYLELMEQLLEAGADPNARLNHHLWYMEYTFGVLRGSGINLRGATPFWRAAYALDLGAMRLLTSWGADANIATIKPPENRRRRPPMEEAEEEQAEEETGEEGEETEGEEQEADPEEEETPPAETEEAQEPPTEEAEGEEQEAAEGEEEGDEEEDEDEDKSGLPPVPVGGPAIYPLHAAAGVGYGQSFAGNAHRYVPNGWLPAVKFLVEEMGADVNARDSRGYTALHHAASRGDIEMILYLVEHGADVTVVSRKGETTADMANGPVQRVQPYPEAVALLEELGSENNHNCVSCE